MVSDLHSTLVPLIPQRVISYMHNKKDLHSTLVPLIPLSLKNIISIYRDLHSTLVPLIPLRAHPEINPTDIFTFYFSSFNSVFYDPTQ